MIGDTLGHYRILDLAGSGGMGVVYRARDERLGRDVALKLLSPELATQPERLRHLEREARSASALNHPNIVTIYEIGQEGPNAFIAMEWVEGKTLRERLASGPMPRDQALQVAAQVAAGVAKAHQAGIVHRDLKPGNIMVTADGIVKVLDFGLAKPAEPAGPASHEPARIPPEEETTRDIAATLTDTSVGTPAYMSPEQAGGRPVDFRSDQFSLGLVLHEMVTGRHPFERGTVLQTIAALLTEPAAPIRASHPEVPPEFDALVFRCLRKDPDQRYADTSALARELEQIRLRHLLEDSPGGKPVPAPVPAPVSRRRASVVRSPAFVVAGLVLVAFMVASALLLRAKGRSPALVQSAATVARPTLAVLPFRPLTEEPEEHELGLGIADAIIAGLGGSPDLIVRPTRLVLPYQDKATDPVEIGKTLRVGAILDGTVQRSGGKLRIQVELWQVPDGTSLWTHKYDVTAGDVFSVQEQIGGEVAKALRVTLTPTGRDRLDTPYSTDPVVYALILHARALELRQGRESLPAAISLYRQAVQKEPGNALAHAWLASACRMYSFLYDPDNPSWIEEAERQSERALELDLNLAEAYAAEAGVLWTPQRRFQNDRALELYRRAVELNPNLATDRGFYAVVLSHVGLFYRAQAEYRRALETDPGDVRALADVAENYLMMGDAPRAEEAARTALGVDPDYSFSKRALVEALIAEGRLDDAETLLARDYLPEAPYYTDWLRGLIAALRGRYAEAESLGHQAAKQGEGRGPYHHLSYGLAQIYALAGEKEAGVRWLRVTAENGMPCYPMFRDDPLLRNLRGYPAYEKLIDDMRVDWERRRDEEHQERRPGEDGDIG